MQGEMPTTNAYSAAAALIVQRGPQPGQRFRLTGATVTVGREATNQVVVDDRWVSRRHASLAWDGRSWVVQDLGSANGTYVNGVRLSAPQTLQDGDTVGLGTEVLLAFQAQPAPGGDDTVADVLPAIGMDRPSQPPPSSSTPPEKRASRRPVLLLVAAAVVLGCCAVAALAAFLLWPGREPGDVVLPPAEGLPTSAEVVPEPLVEEGAAPTPAAGLLEEETVPATPPVAPAPPGGSPPGALIQPEDLVYIGAFRLPDDAGPPRTFEYGGNAMTFNPDGDPANTDPYPGSLFVTGHDRVAYGELPDGSQVAEVSIPEPAIAANPADLPQAAFIQGFHDVTAGYFTQIEEIPKVGMQYLNHPDTGPKLHLAWGQHLQPPDVPSHAWVNATLDTPDLQGVWFIGDQNLYSTNAYMFDIPASWADAYAGGRYLATGRMRDGGQGGMGPTLFAYRPWLPDGSAPPSGTHLEELTLLLYDNVYNTPDLVRCLEGYQHADAWEGGAWMTTPSGKSAVLFAGTKSTGTKFWYGYINPQGPEYACVDQHVTDFDTCRMADGASCPAEDYAGCCDEAEGTCVSYRGWWSTRFDAQFILYDPAQLAQVASGAIDPWEPQPYAAVDIDEHLYLEIPEWDVVNEGSGVQRRNRIGPAAYDRNSALLYVLEMSADGAKPVVHVWRVAD